MRKFVACGLFVLIGIACLIPARAVTTEQADQAVQAFNKTYWNASGKYFYKKDDKTGVLDFWLTAHAWETIMDAYVRTGSAEYKQQIRDIYDGFIARQTTDWTRNDYNDDIMWWTIACARAYEITGEARYLSQSKAMFDWVYNTQRDSIKGGIWWKNNEHLVKNSCVVQPAIISAAFLARHLKDDSYRVKAESLYAWDKRVLVDPSGGRVYDNINNAGKVSTFQTTYNQGTWIGSGVILGRIADAKKTADWTKANMCNAAGIFREAGQGDFGAFKLICARYVMSLSRQPGQEAYAQWMETNAAKVWANRRADGVMGYDWNNPAPSTGVECQSAAGGVSLLNLLATPNSAIRPLDSQADHARSGSGIRMVLSSHGDVTATGWLFDGSMGNDLRPETFRRLDGRASVGLSAR